MRNRVRLDERSAVDELYARSRKGGGGGGGGATFLVDVDDQASFTFNAEANFASVRNIPATEGTTLLLPPAPSNGDSYQFAVEDGSCGPGNPVFLSGNGKTVNGSSSPVFFISPTSWARASYDEAAGGWVVQLSNTAGVEGAAPGTPAYNPAWYAFTAVYWDPANESGLASDTNAGASSGAPLLTWAEIVRRYGSTSPEFPYGQTVTFNMLSAQPAGEDAVFFEPRVSNGGRAILTGFAALVAAGASFAAGTLSGGFGYTGATPSAGGVQLTMAAVPSYVVGTVLLFNETTSGYAFVDAITGGNATLTQPLTAASVTNVSTSPTGVVQNTWAAGNTIQPYVVPNLNLKKWAPVGGDVSSASALSGGYVLFCSIADTSGAGTSIYPHVTQSAVNVLSCCVVRGVLSMTMVTGKFGGLYVTGCCIVGWGIFEPAGDTIIYGGVFQTGVDFYGAGVFLLASTAIVHGSANIYAGVAGILNANECFSDAAWSLIASTLIVFNGATFWGSYSLDLCPTGGNSTFVNNSGSTFTLKALLTNGALTIGASQTTGTSYSAGTWTDGIALTPANLDTHNGLQNPRMGARFTNGT